MINPQRTTMIPIYLRILSTLHFFGHGSYQLNVGTGYAFAISQSSVSRCISEISNVMVEHLLNRWIHFPNDEVSRNEVEAGFQELDHRFPNLLGIIDCTHVKIVGPPMNHPVYPAAPYYCRKGYYSLNTQIVCDSKYKILNMNARFPGSVHDSAIWMSSNVRTMLYRQFMNGNNGYLLGDGGYPLQPWLLVPFTDFMPDSPESRFNTALSQQRIRIEHVNGILKSRFRCTLSNRALHYNPIRAAKIIYSCGILHNMAIHYNVDLPHGEYFEDNNEVDVIPGPINQDWFNQGNITRQQIVNNFFQ
jgi:hypothetical protein